MRELLAEVAAALNRRATKLSDLHGRAQVVLMLICLAGARAGGVVGGVLAVGGFAGVLLVTWWATAHENGRFIPRGRSTSSQRRQPRSDDRP